jgi:hypothetical protein
VQEKVLIVIPSICKVGELYMNNVYVNAKNEHFNANLRKGTKPINIFVVLLQKGRKDWSSLLFVSTNYLRANL